MRAGWGAAALLHQRCWVWLLWDGRGVRAPACTGCSRVVRREEDNMEAGGGAAPPGAVTVATSRVI